MNNVTHYRAQCGNNFHPICIEKWKEEAISEAAGPQGDMAVLRCPFCRDDWNMYTTPTQWFPKMHHDGFQIYLQWLHKRQILVGPDHESPQYYLGRLVLAYDCVVLLKDDSFCLEVLQAIVEVCVDHRVYPDTFCVTVACSSVSEPCNLGKLLVGLYMETNPNDVNDLKDSIDWVELPFPFTSDLAQSSWKDRPSKRGCGL